MTIITTSTTAQQIVGDSETLIVTQTGSVSNAAIAIYSQSSSSDRGNVIIAGAVASESTGVYLSGTDGFGNGYHEILVGASGTITSNGDGIATVGNRNEVVNQGSILSNFAGVDMEDEENTVINSGTITGATYGVRFNVLGTGIDEVSLANSGTVAGYYGVNTVQAGLELVNSGTISGTNRAITHSQNAIFHALDLDNSGVIQSTDIYAVHISGSSDVRDTIVNSGEIHGAIITGDGSDRVYNTGHINGDVDLESGNDIFYGRGGTTTNSLVMGGLGNDVMYIDGGTRRVSGGDGTDTLFLFGEVEDIDLFERIYVRGPDDFATYAGIGDTDIYGNRRGNEIHGEVGEDTIYGRRGDDDLFGGDDADELYGGADNDHLEGGTGTDQLFGNQGKDVLFGDAGDDTLYGGHGADILEGGTGADNLYGGTGSDHFVFNEASDTANATPDRIHDFDTSDKIDLSEWVEGEFIFRGTGAFQNNGDAQLRYSITSNGNTKIRIDEDGDRVADSTIVLHGYAEGLNAGDFFL